MNLKDIGNKNVDITKELPTVLSLCSGYTGLERGLELAGFKHRTVAFVEIEAYAIARLANKMEAGELLPAPIWSNLKTLPVEPFRDRVDLLTGGYPCQPFSGAGKRKGEEDPRHLWPHIREIVRAVRPFRCFFENVEGHISLGLREVISDLESLGYKTTWGIFSAREVGAPHQRKRVYILADRQSVICERSKLKKGRGGESQMSPRVRGDSGAYKLADTDSEFARRNPALDENTKRQASIRAKPSGGGCDNGENELADSNGVRCDRRKLSDRVSQRSVEIEAQQRPEQSVVRSEAERCRGDSGENELADSKGIGVQRLRSSGIEKSDTHGEEELPLRESKRPRDAQWEVEPRLGRGFDGPASWVDGTWEMGVERVTAGCPDRIDRIRLLGNGIVPQTAAKAWLTLQQQLVDSTNA